MRRFHPPWRGAISTLLALAVLPIATAHSWARAETEHPAQSSGAGEALASPRPFPAFPRSLGQPPSLRVRWGPLAGYEFHRERAAERLDLSVEGSILGSGLWWLAGTGECAARLTGASPGGALGARIGIPWLSIGPEYRVPENDLSLALSFRFPLRRGGLFRHGDMLRVDYFAGRHELLAGLSFPSPFEPYRVSRPAATTLRLPSTPIPSRPLGTRPVPLSPATEHHLAEVRESVLWLSRLLTPHLKPEGFAASAAKYRDHIATRGHGFREEEARYHTGLDSAFASVLEGSVPEGRRVAALAESVLFRDVIIPFDRTFGQQRGPADAGGFCARALVAFRGRLDREPLAARPRDRDSLRASCVEVFRRILPAIRDASKESSERWREPFLLWDNQGALGWLPINYGLRPDQYDTQEEWDGALAAMTGEPFSDANQIHYLMMEQFHLQLKRMIRNTRHYQVTIIHDFRGLTPEGNADLFGWDIAVDGYIAAFVKAVRELDAGTRDRLPQFFLLLDANYYEANGSRGIMTFLEDLTRPVHAHFEHESIRDQVLAAQDTLLRAIRASSSLSKATEREIRDAFRVNVSITNPFDPAFVLDISRRDHRKVAFRDISEEDPGSGEAVFTGQGVGEHYNGTGWEDRGILLRGPALVRLKSAARDLLIGQGFTEREIPQCLRPRPFPPDYAERCRRLRADGWTTRSAVVDNETGFGAKDASILKAAIYNLAPPGSYILSYDSLWSSEFWAGMFVSAALRGVNVFPVGPVPANAPSAAAPTLYCLRRTLRMMVEAKDYFADGLARSGGSLRVGLYNQDIPTSDFRRRIQAFERGRAQHPFLTRVIPTDPSVDAFLHRVEAGYGAVPMVALRLRPNPLLHMKCQLFGTAEAFRIHGLAEWMPVLQEHLRIRRQETSGMDSPGVTPGILAIRDPRSGRTLPEAFEARLDSLGPGARERAIFTFTVGSHNQNPRSLLLDGEDLVAVSGMESAITIIDMAFILCVAEWPDDVGEFDRLFRDIGLPFYMKPFLRVLRDLG